MGEVALRTPQATERLNTEQVRYIANTEIIPRHLRGKPDAIMATILKGRALGLDDIHSLTAINFIEGKATLAAETMLTLVRRQGHSVGWEAVPGESCTVTGTRKDTGDTGTVTWTLGMAKDAGLTGKDNWRRYPDQMLFWRAVSQLCRFLFADVLMGVSYTIDEAEEAAERGRVTQAVADLPMVEEQHVRTEPLAGPSEAQLNRIAHLEDRAGEGYRLVLRGVFGVDMASELTADQAIQYEAMLEMSAPPEDSGSEGDSGAEAGDTTAEASPDPVEDVADASSPADLEDEPAPEGITPDKRTIELAGETEIPVGQYRGTALKDIHDSWLEYAMRANNHARLPSVFVEALDLWVENRKPEIWKAAQK